MSKQFSVTVKDVMRCALKLQFQGFTVRITAYQGLNLKAGEIKPRNYPDSLLRLLKVK